MKLNEPPTMAKCVTKLRCYLVECGPDQVKDALLVIALPSS